MKWFEQIKRIFTKIKPEKLNTNGMINFSGRSWHVKSGTSLGPGPNNWNPNNVWVDANGKLHLKISYNKTTSKWDCAEVWTSEKLGFGTYEWVVESKIETFDKNVVLGMFNYLTTGGGGSEIDIEFAKWGIETLSKMGSFTVWPTKAGLKRWTSIFPVTSGNTETFTKHTFNWQSKSVTFKSVDAKDNVLGSAVYKPSRYTQYIPQIPEPLNMNLWLFEGNPGSLTTDKTVEVVISSFKKT